MHHCSFNHGLSLVFFSTRRTVSSEIASTISNSTRRSASSRNVHCLRPWGGAEQAKAIRRASARPSSLRCRRGRSCGLRLKAASTPSSTNRWRTRSTVVTPTSSASTMRWSIQAGPPAEASALNRIRAWVSLRAAALPDAIKAWSSWRSSSVSVTLYRFITCLLESDNLQESLCSCTHHFKRGGLLVHRAPTAACSPSGWIIQRSTSIETPC